MIVFTTILKSSDRFFSILFDMSYFVFVVADWYLGISDSFFSVHESSSKDFERHQMSIHQTQSELTVIVETENSF